MLPRQPPRAGRPSTCTRCEHDCRLAEPGADRGPASPRTRSRSRRDDWPNPGRAHTVILDRRPRRGSALGPRTGTRATPCLGCWPVRPTDGRPNRWWAGSPARPGGGRSCRRGGARWATPTRRRPWPERGLKGCRSSPPPYGPSFFLRRHASEEGTGVSWSSAGRTGTWLPRRAPRPHAIIRGEPRHPRLGAEWHLRACGGKGLHRKHRPNERVSAARHERAGGPCRR